jgi:hypothetical protein
MIDGEMVLLSRPFFTFPSLVPRQFSFHLYQFYLKIGAAAFPIDIQLLCQEHDPEKRLRNVFFTKQFADKEGRLKFN